MSRQNSHTHFSAVANPLVNMQNDKTKPPDVRCSFHTIKQNIKKPCTLYQKHLKQMKQFTNFMNSSMFVLPQNGESE